MNQSIADILEIMTIVRDKFDAKSNVYNLSTYRNEACYQIAVRRDREKNTIANAYIRALRPWIKNTEHFQKLLNDWILNESTELIDILGSRIPEREKSETFSDLMIKKTDVQKLLSVEVMDSISSNKFPEGRSKIEIHLTKERKQQLVTEAKSLWRSINNGDIKCSVCGFSFLGYYGKYGQDFIEAHHNIPISTLSEETIVKISDLSPVCSNCHRVIHRKRPFLTVEELRKIVELRRIS